MFLGKIGWLALASMVCAQLLKPLFASPRRGGAALRRVFDTGGMPSSHTALVTTLTLSILQVEGSDSTLFAVAWIFSLYFVFEATGLRQEVGDQAKVLNQMLEELSKTHHLDRSHLKELVGHTWQEVLAGAALGGVVYLLGLRWLRAG
jgi:acid phosphatase family membrane protein YuiD